MKIDIGIAYRILDILSDHKLHTQRDLEEILGRAALAHYIKTMHSLGLITSVFESRTKKILVMITLKGYIVYMNMAIETPNKKQELKNTLVKPLLISRSPKHAIRV